MSATLPIRVFRYLRNGMHSSASADVNDTSTCSTGEAMDAVEVASTHETADAGTPAEPEADKLFDAGDMFSNGHNGRVVVSNGVSKASAAPPSYLLVEPHKPIAAGRAALSRCLLHCPSSTKHEPAARNSDEGPYACRN